MTKNDFKRIKNQTELVNSNLFNFEYSLDNTADFYEWLIYKIKDNNTNVIELIDVFEMKYLDRLNENDVLVWTKDKFLRSNCVLFPNKFQSFFHQKVPYIFIIGVILAFVGLILTNIYLIIFSLAFSIISLSEITVLKLLYRLERSNND